MVIYNLTPQQIELKREKLLKYFKYARLVWSDAAVDNWIKTRLEKLKSDFPYQDNNPLSMNCVDYNSYELEHQLAVYYNNDPEILRDQLMEKFPLIINNENDGLIDNLDLKPLDLDKYQNYFNYLKTNNPSFLTKTWQDYSNLDNQSEISNFWLRYRESLLNNNLIYNNAVNNTEESDYFSLRPINTQEINRLDDPYTPEEFADEIFNSMEDTEVNNPYTDLDESGSSTEAQSTDSDISEAENLRLEDEDYDPEIIGSRQVAYFETGYKGYLDFLIDLEDKKIEEEIWDYKKNKKKIKKIKIKIIENILEYNSMLKKLVVYGLFRKYNKYYNDFSNYAEKQTALLFFIQVLNIVWYENTLKKQGFYISNYYTKRLQLTKLDLNYLRFRKFKLDFLSEKYDKIILTYQPKLTNYQYLKVLIKEDLIIKLENNIKFLLKFFNYIKIDITNEIEIMKIRSKIYDQMTWSNFFLKIIQEKLEVINYRFKIKEKIKNYIKEEITNEIEIMKIRLKIYDQMTWSNFFLKIIQEKLEIINYRLKKHLRKQVEIEYQKLKTYQEKIDKLEKIILDILNFFINKINLEKQIITNELKLINYIFKEIFNKSEFINKIKWFLIDYQILVRIEKEKEIKILDILNKITLFKYIENKIQEKLEIINYRFKIKEKIKNYIKEEITNEIEIMKIRSKIYDQMTWSNFFLKIIQEKLEVINYRFKIKEKIKNYIKEEITNEIEIMKIRSKIYDQMTWSNFFLKIIQEKLEIINYRLKKHLRKQVEIEYQKLKTYQEKIDRYFFDSPEILKIKLRYKLINKNLWSQYINNKFQIEYDKFNSNLEKIEKIIKLIKKTEFNWQFKQQDFDIFISILKAQYIQPFYYLIDYISHLKRYHKLKKKIRKKILRGLEFNWESIKNRFCYLVFKRKKKRKKTREIIKQDLVLDEMPNIENQELDKMPNIENQELDKIRYRYTHPEIQNLMESNNYIARIKDPKKKQEIYQKLLQAKLDINEKKPQFNWRIYSHKQILDKVNIREEVYNLDEKEKIKLYNNFLRESFSAKFTFQDVFYRVFKFYELPLIRTKAQKDLEYFINIFCFPDRLASKFTSINFEEEFNKIEDKDIILNFFNMLYKIAKEINEIIYLITWETIVQMNYELRHDMAYRHIMFVMEQLGKIKSIYNYYQINSKVKNNVVWLKEYLFKIKLPLRRIYEKFKLNKQIKIEEFKKYTKFYYITEVWKSVWSNPFAFKQYFNPFKPLLRNLHKKLKKKISNYEISLLETKEIKIEKVNLIIKKKFNIEEVIKNSDIKRNIQIKFLDLEILINKIIKNQILNKFKITKIINIIKDNLTNLKLSINNKIYSIKLFKRLSRSIEPAHIFKSRKRFPKPYKYTGDAIIWLPYKRISYQREAKLIKRKAELGEYFKTQSNLIIKYKLIIKQLFDNLINSINNFLIKIKLKKKTFKLINKTVEKLKNLPNLEQTETEQLLIQEMKPPKLIENLEIKFFLIKINFITLKLDYVIKLSEIIHEIIKKCC